MAQTLTDVRARLELLGSMTVAAEGVLGPLTVGKKLTSIDLDDANIGYVFTVESTGVSDVATLTLSSGAVAQTTGSPDIGGGDGKDAEGETLGTAAKILGVLMFAEADNAGTITVNFSVGSLPDLVFNGTGQTVPHWLACINPDGVTPGAGTCSFTFDTTGDKITVVVFAKTA